MYTVKTINSISILPHKNVCMFNITVFTIYIKHADILMGRRRETISCFHSERSLTLPPLELITESFESRCKTYCQNEKEKCQKNITNSSK